MHILLGRSVKTYLQRHLFKEWENCCTISHDSPIYLPDTYTPYSFRGSFFLKFVCPPLPMSLWLCILVIIPSSQRRKVMQSCTAFSQERVGRDWAGFKAFPRGRRYVPHSSSCQSEEQRWSLEQHSVLPVNLCPGPRLNSISAVHCFYSNTLSVFFLDMHIDKFFVL